jgi:NAD(P)-dependent dehydrogenase (short-subunit alcohol dehydrogenase family)
MLTSEAERFEMTPAEARTHWSAASPNKRIATARDVAGAVLFLASNAARHINGVALPVDGGNLAR